MVSPLRRVLLCATATAGWSRSEAASSWRDLGYQHPVKAALAESQHGELLSRLEEAGVEVLWLPEGDRLSLDAVYAHDASLITDAGAILLSMGKVQRVGEPERHAAFFHATGVPVAGRIEPPGTAEAGDMVWLDPHTLLVGRGYRTNLAGIEQLERLLAPGGVEVLRAPLPHDAGPGACLHLMSLISLLSERIAIVDLPRLTVQTVEMLRQRGFEFIEIDPSERDTQACNVVSLGNRRLLALEENSRTNDLLRKEGFDVRTFPGTELCQNGGGGPTCLTRPLLRDRPTP